MKRPAPSAHQPANACMGTPSNTTASPNPTMNETKSDENIDIADSKTLRLIATQTVQLIASSVGWCTRRTVVNGT